MEETENKSLENYKYYKFSPNPLDVLTHTRTVSLPKKANNSRWILMAVSFSFFKTQCNSSLFDVLRHGRKEVIHSEGNTMQTTTLTF